MPDWNSLIRKQLSALNLAPTREAEIAEELTQHAEDRYREFLAAGILEVDARRLALEDVTGHHLLADGLRAVERIEVRDPVVTGGRGKVHLLEGLAQDLRYGLRSLRKNPGFAAVAMLVLALGIGANTAIFSVVNGVLLQPLPYPDPSRLVSIFETNSEFTRFSVAYPNYLDWRQNSRSFSAMGTYQNTDFNLTGKGEPEHLSGLYVSASLFPTLGTKPLMGHSFLPGEDRPGASCSAMLSYGFWRERFGADPHILGKILSLNVLKCTVIGVLRADFRLDEDAQIYVPIEQSNSAELHSRASHSGLTVIGRLKQNVSLAEAQAEITSICKHLAQQYPATNASSSAKLVGMKDDLVRHIRATLLLLLCAVGFVLIIACANVANLLLARATARRREFAIRTALGAERWRIARQILIESMLLSLGAAIIGLLFAHWGTNAILAAVPGTLPRSDEIGMDWHVLLFTLLASIATGILFGLLPAFRSASANPQESLKEGTRGAGGGRHRTEAVFVTLEVGLAVILLSGAGLMIQSIWRLLQVHPGLNVRHVLTMDLALSPKAMSSPAVIRAAYRQLLDRVRSIPGVKAAAITNLIPLSENDNENSFWLGAGPQPPQDRLRSAVFYVVTADYPNVMQIPLRRGRFFTNRDDVNAAPVAVIDDVMARHFFLGQDPVGKQISFTELGPVQIVGVVGHVKQWGLDSDDTNTIRDQIYFPILQVPDKFLSEAETGATLAVRTAVEPMKLLSAVRTQVAGPTRDQPIYAVKTMEQVIARSLSQRRFTMLVLIVFGAVALLLAAVGIYGVMSYAVTRRVHEIGIRATLGASRQEIVALVLREGMKLAAAGMLLGLPAAFALTRFMANLLFGVVPGDPITLSAVSALLGAIALLACYIPARRATAVDPMVALRCE